MRLGEQYEAFRDQCGSCRETMHGASRLIIGCVEITMGPLGTNMVSVWFNMGPIDG